MRNMLKSTLAAAVLTAAAFSLTPSAASAGVVGLSDQQAVTPASATENVHWRPYCHRHYRHWGYCGTCGVYRVYGYAPAYYGYYGYANPVTTAVGLAAWPFWGWW